MGGALVSGLLGPKYVRTESKSGSWIADRPPIKMFAFPERQVSVSSARQLMKDKESRGKRGKSSSSKGEGKRSGKDEDSR